MKRLARFAVTLGAWLAAAPGSASAQGGSTSRVLYKEVVVEAPIERVWHAWTTEEGIRFISNQSRIEMEVGGAYELFLDGPVESDGRRGAEGARVLAFVPHEMLAFTWTFPPAVMELRAANERTHVVVMLDSLDQAETRVRLYSIGWKSGPAWDQGYAYFDQAWGFVLDLLKQSLESADQGSAASPGDETVHSRR